MSRIGLVLFISVLLSLPAMAREAIQFGIHQQYQSVRAMGMGNAFSAIADDYNAIFYNPAGLARLKKGQMNFFLQAGMDMEAMDFVDDLSNAAGADEDEIKAIEAVLSENFGEHYGLRGPSLGAFWARPKWGIAFIPIDLSLDLELHQGVGPAVNAIVQNDSTFAFALAKNKKFGANLLSYGATFKGIYRVDYDKYLAAVDLADQDGEVFKVEEASEGLALDVDLGVLFTPQVPSKGFFSAFRLAKPTFSLVVRNLIDAGFSQNLHLYHEDSSDNPEKLHRRVDAGASFHLPDWWVWNSRLAIELRDIGHPYYTFEKGFHLGAEFNWKLASWFQGGWRAGLQQGFDLAYWTAGFTGKFAVFQLDLASYMEEFGTSGAPNGARRYMFKMAVDF